GGDDSMRYMRGGGASGWTKRGEEIVGSGMKPEPPPGKPAPPRSYPESVLYYHRPLLEDGEVEYEFWYEPDKTHCHPALDRLCLLLEPKGVRVHWLTDGGHERGGLAPENVADEPANRRGPAELPLKAKAWNAVRLTLRGGTIKLALNGVEVYERPLEAANHRALGLFHYTDEGGVRVRNVVYRGQWP